MFHNKFTARRASFWHNAPLTALNKRINYEPLLLYIAAFGAARYNSRMDDDKGAPREPIFFDAEEELIRRRFDRERKRSARVITLCLISLALILLLAGGASYYIGDRSIAPAEFMAFMNNESAATVIEIANPTPAPTPEPTPTPTPEPKTYQRTRILIDGVSYAVLASREAAEELIAGVMEHYEAMITETGELVSDTLEAVTLEPVPESDTTPLDSVEELTRKFTSENTPLTVITKLSYTYTSEVEPEEERDSDEYLVLGTRVVESLGRMGVTRTTVTGEYHNGALEGNISSSTEIIIEAQPYRVRVGAALPSTAKEPGRREGKKGPSAEGISFKKPISGSVASNFGQRRGEMHLGLDYEADVGATVKASAAGKVVCVMERGGYGLIIEIDHGQGFVTRYAHLQEAKVALGDEVAQGDEIALLGESGNAEGSKPVLHFELLINGEAYNPRFYLK